ncbi:hypothetical protein G6011_05002 [Alternaria panax]|uniref:Fungal N-terminal domain-containing protein n=1 Tax=Alternaria panax TaxID=48097 RepID=A0AAD4FCM2_9PLEO|nr:hypothetical protein G6011_05002 [Alternaria panax]
MTSFGLSIGEVILISNYAYSVYKSCKNVGGNFQEITADVSSLRSLLAVLNNECRNPQSSFQKFSPAQKGDLAACLQDCKADLRSVKMILHDFRSLNTRDARYRDSLACLHNWEAGGDKGKDSYARCWTTAIAEWDQCCNVFQDREEY